MAKLHQDEIRDLPIDSIVPNDINPNKMPHSTQVRMKASIEKFGVLNPILVRKQGEKYQIVDGEWRWTLSKELGRHDIPVKIMDVSDDELEQLIFATTLKGKHDPYEAAFLAQHIGENANEQTLQACNLSGDRLHRKTGYMKAEGEGVKILQRGKNKQNPAIRNEADVKNVNDIKDYRALLVVPLIPADYERVVAKLESYGPDFSTGLMKAMFGE